MSGVLVLTAFHDVCGVGKADPALPAVAESGIATCVVEVKVGIDYHHDIRWPHANLRQAVLEHREALGAVVLEAVDVSELLVFLVAGAGVDQDQARGVLDEQAAHSQLNSIALVGCDLFLPQRLRDNAEHRAAVELLTTSLDGMNSQRADLAAINEWSRRGHAVVSLVTDVGIAGGRRLRFFPERAPSSAWRSLHVSQPRSSRSRIIFTRHFAVAMASPPARWRL